MSDNKFTESMEVEAVGNLKPGDIGWGTCDGCEKNIHKLPGVLLQGVTQEAAKLLYEKVEIVAEGTKAKMAELEREVQEYKEENVRLLQQCLSLYRAVKKANLELDKIEESCDNNVWFQKIKERTY